jgi:hypothetical protein
MMLAVVHIHKTAGTTLSGVLKHANGGTHCDVLAEDPQAPFFSAEDLRHLRRFYPRLRSILGHDVRAYSDLETVMPDIEWVAFLREPLTRTASHYQYDVQRGGVDLPFESGSPTTRSATARPVSSPAPGAPPRRPSTCSAASPSSA